MFVGRLIGWLLLAAAVILAGDEAIRSLAAGHWTPTPLGKLWYDLDRGSLNLIQAVTQRYLWPPLWDPGAVTILTWSAWAVFAVLGLIFVVLFRARAPKRKRWFN
jgi:hypothetical protein